MPNKVDELSLLLSRDTPDLVALYETWLKPYIDDSIVDIDISYVIHQIPIPIKLFVIFYFMTLQGC